MANSTFSVFGADIRIKGNVVASADLHIDGHVEGDVTCTSLVQGESGEIVGAVKAESARLYTLLQEGVDTSIQEIGYLPNGNGNGRGNGNGKGADHSNASKQGGGDTETDADTTDDSSTVKANSFGNLNGFVDSNGCGNIFKK